MTAKELFQAMQDAERAIKAIRYRQATYKAMGTMLGNGPGDGIHTHNGKSPVESVLERLENMQEALERKAQWYMDAAETAEKVLDGIKSPRYKQILSMRYWEKKPWEVIAGEMHLVGDGYVFQVHREALKEAQKVLDGLQEE